MRRLSVTHLSRCVGCETCEVICSLAHEGVCSPARSRIKVHSDPFTGRATIEITESCDLCEGEVECLKWCPAGVLSYREDG